MFRKLTPTSGHPSLATLEAISDETVVQYRQAASRSMHAR